MFRETEITRRPQPYYKKSHHAWYVNLNGRPKRLASEIEGEEVAYKQYDKLMVGRQPVANDDPVVGLLDRALGYHKTNTRSILKLRGRNVLNSLHDNK